jgi:hypothetical protein
VLAATRQGLTVAVDAHPGPGSLTDRLPLDLDVPAGELLGLLDHPALSGGELLACLAVRGPAVVGVGGSPAPGRRVWTLLVHGLARHADALVLDCGPGLGDPGARAAVAAADQLVLVTEPAPSREAGGSPARWPTSGAAAPARLLPGVRGVVPLPPPPPARPPRGWAEVPPWWRGPALELASRLAADWPALGIAVGG